MTYVIICEDMVAFRENPAIKIPEGEESTQVRAWVAGRGGAHICYNADFTKSMVHLSSIEGMENLGLLPYITVTTLEAIHGYRRQVEIDGVPQFGDPTIDVIPAHTPQKIVGWEDDLTQPIYEIVRHEKQKTVTRTHDEEDNLLPSPIEVPVVKVKRVYNDAGEIIKTIETPVMVLDYYETTSEIQGYKSKPIYGPGDEVPEQTITTPNPIMEDVPGDPALLAQYNAIYDQTPFTDEDGVVHEKPKVFLQLGDHTTDHLLEAA